MGGPTQDNSKKVGAEINLLQLHKRVMNMTIYTSYSGKILEFFSQKHKRIVFHYIKKIKLR
jgi:hypothetical protein